MLDGRRPRHYVLLCYSSRLSDHSQCSVVCSHDRCSQTHYVNGQQRTTTKATTQDVHHLHTVDVTDGIHEAVRLLGNGRRSAFLVVPVHFVQHLPGSLYLCIFHADADNPRILARLAQCQTKQEHIRYVKFIDSNSAGRPSVIH